MEEGELSCGDEIPVADLKLSSTQSLQCVDPNNK